MAIFSIATAYRFTSYLYTNALTFNRSQEIVSLVPPSPPLPNVQTCASLRVSDLPPIDHTAVLPRIPAQTGASAVPESANNSNNTNHHHHHHHQEQQKKEPNKNEEKRRLSFLCCLFSEFCLF